MTGLLLKDGYTMLRQSKVFILMVIILAFLPSDFIYGYAIFYAALLATTTLAYDERARWDKLVNMFPYTEGQIVGSKYIIGYIAVGITMLLTIVGKYANALINGKIVTPVELVTLVLVVCVATITESITLPLSFLVGVEKGRLVLIFFCVVTIVGLMSLLETADLSQIQISLPRLLWGGLGITVLINFISFQLAKILYRRKKS